MSSKNTNKHITIEEARERGLTQIVKQLVKDKKTRQALGMRLLDAPIPRKTPGRPKNE
jgi:hypothetical protein